MKRLIAAFILGIVTCYLLIWFEVPTWQAIIGFLGGTTVKIVVGAVITPLLLKTWSPIRDWLTKLNPLALQPFRHQLSHSGKLNECSDGLCKLVT